MCMLCVVPPNVIPSREKLENSALNNPHGFGFAIAVPSEKRIISERTMNADESINRFLELRGKYPEGHAMWHARYATHGSTSLDNCHPFQLGGFDTQTYIAHNGVLPTIETKGEKRSDTRIFAEDILLNMGGVSALDNEQMYNVIENFTSGSKVCVLSVDPIAKQECYIIHEDRGKRDLSGVWWSNDSCYLDWGYSYTSSSAGLLKPLGNYTFADDEEIYVCEVCSQTQGVEDSIYEAVCNYCGSCFDCSMYFSDCQCWTNKSSSKGGWEIEY